MCEHLCRVGDHPELADLVEKYLPMDMFSSTQCRRFIEATLRSRHEGRALEEVLRDVVDPTGEFQRFRAAVEFAPSKIRDEEMSHADAVRDLVRFLWRRELQHRRDAMDSADDSRTTRADRAQLTQDINALRNWEEGSLVIEDHLENAGKAAP